jgi:polar amino acid transport system substrate-binding protein
MDPKSAWSKALRPLALALALPLAAQGPVPGPETITYLTEDYPASNYVEDGRLKGIATDLLKVVWKDLGVPEQPIQVMNWARAFRQTETTPGTMLFAMTRNAERESLFQWVGPIYHGFYILVSRAGREAPLKSLADAGRYRVAVLRQDIGQRLLTGAGVAEERLEKVDHVRQLIQMLEAGRVDLICVYADTLRIYNLQQRLDPARFKQELVAAETVLYFAFNKATDPRLVARFQAALDRHDRERRRIVKAYGCTP